jgi:hypothetical protein
LDNIFLRFAPNSFEKRQQILAAFQEFCENPGNVLTNRREGIKIHKSKVLHSLSSKEFCIFKSICCSAAKNLSIQYNIEG